VIALNNSATLCLGSSVASVYFNVAILRRKWEAHLESIVASPKVSV
jgi:hypothetical protein